MVYLLARYYAASTLLLYGFAKVMGAQFTVLDSQLLKPMGEVSGFWLTWYYFGYSAVYSALVAWSQIVGAVLLCFQRTALVGALLLLPVLVNIVAIDVGVVGFPLSSGALQQAIGVLCALLVIVAFHAPELFRFFVKRRDDLLVFAGRPRWLVGVPFLAAAGMVAYQAHEAYWLANTNNRAPTVLDGAWRVDGVEPATAGVPEWMFLEYNRAHMVVFRFADGRTETHDFRVDPAAHGLDISETWLRPGTEILHGTWKREGDRLQVSGEWHGTEPIQLRLMRKPMKVRDHE